jgi:uncharacterized YigZ family protein
MLTLKGPARLEVEIRRSRFVAHAERVDSLADTLAFHESVADPAATHNCWAWRLDHQYRFNDDGEPGGTAGKPILGAIEGKGLDHVMIVVTRYFGGIKLGVGGLVRAYSGSAAKCIDRAGVREIRPSIECLVRAGFEWTGPVYSALDSCGAARLTEHYRGDGIEIRIKIDESEFQTLKALLRDTTRGKVSLTPSD